MRKVTGLITSISFGVLIWMLQDYLADDMSEIMVRWITAMSLFGMAIGLGFAFWPSKKKELKKQRVSSVRLSPSLRSGRKYVSIKVENRDRKKPMLCRAIIAKMERLENREWIKINTDECGPLSWDHGDSDNNGYKEVFLKPEFINIARLPSLSNVEMNYFIRKQIVFTHLIDEPRKAGKYRIWIKVEYKNDDYSEIAEWFGYIYSIDIEDSDKHRLDISEMENIFA